MPPQTPRTVPFVLFGVGGVGSALLETIVSSRQLHRERYNIEFSAVAVCDSKAAVRGAPGLSDDAIGALIAHKASGKPLSQSTGTVDVRADGQEASEFLAGVASSCAESAPGCIVVDCTATDATVPALLMAAGAASDVRAVSANKKPFAGPMDVFSKLVLSPRGLPRVRYEATVGAGLPVIAALQRVVGSADQVSLISGSFSGTLGYVMSGLQVRRAAPVLLTRAPRARLLPPPRGPLRMCPPTREPPEIGRDRPRSTREPPEIARRHMRSTRDVPPPMQGPPPTADLGFIRTLWA